MLALARPELVRRLVRARHRAVAYGHTQSQHIAALRRAWTWAPSHRGGEAMAPMAGDPEGGADPAPSLDLAGGDGGSTFDA
jgi:hypothetical protein